jgi:hypothetical protein
LLTLEGATKFCLILFLLFPTNVKSVEATVISLISFFHCKLAFVFHTQLSFFLYSFSLSLFWSFFFCKSYVMFFFFPSHFNVFDIIFAGKCSEIAHVFFEGCCLFHFWYHIGFKCLLNIVMLIKTLLLLLSSSKNHKQPKLCWI